MKRSHRGTAITPASIPRSRRQLDSELLLFRIVSPTIAVTSFFVMFAVRGMGHCRGARYRTKVQ